MRHALALTLALASIAEGARAAAAVSVTRTPRTIEGWTVLADDRLLSPPGAEPGRRALRFLEAKLADIACVLPAEPLRRLREVRIVIDRDHGALRSLQYHPSAEWLERNGYSRDLAGCVHIPRAADLAVPRNVREQPWVILHELAHAYHHQVLGYDDASVHEAYERFVADGRGNATLLHNGTRARHYALTNDKEFFAEMTEAYFGMNDFFPFNRAELISTEPDIYDFMRRVWEPAAGGP